MDRLSEKVAMVIDGHVHLRNHRRFEHFQDIRRHVGADRMNIVCIVGPDDGAGNAKGLYAKLAGAGDFYSFGGLNHLAYKSDGRVQPPPLAEQVDEMLAVGFDGIKLIEGKPSVREDWYPFAADDDYYADFFARAEQRDAPVVWHVGDPDYCWGPAYAEVTSNPDWAYGADHVSREQLNTEVDNVLARHPRLRVMLAHFFFMAGDLDRLGRLLDEHPNVCVDMALGWSLLFYLSADPARSREFFIEHQNQVIYGTDIGCRNGLSLAAKKSHSIRRFLETDEVFTVPDKDGVMTMPGGESELRGVDLPADVLAKVFAGNFQALAGADPKPVDGAAAMDYCRRYAELSAKMTGDAIEETDPGMCLAEIEKL